MSLISNNASVDLHNRSYSRSSASAAVSAGDALHDTAALPTSNPPFTCRSGMDQEALLLRDAPGSESTGKRQAEETKADGSTPRNQQTYDDLSSQRLNRPSRKAQAQKAIVHNSIEESCETGAESLFKVSNSDKNEHDSRDLEATEVLRNLVKMFKDSAAEGPSKTNGKSTEEMEAAIRELLLSYDRKISDVAQSPNPESRSPENGVVNQSAKSLKDRYKCSQCEKVKESVSKLRYCLSTFPL